MESPEKFVLDFVELAALTFLIYSESNKISYVNTGFVGKVVSRFIIMISVTVYTSTKGNGAICSTLDSK